MSDAPTPTEIPSAEVDEQPRRRLKRLILLLVLPVLALTVIGWFYLHGGRYIETDNAYVKAEKVPISAEVSGTIKEVLVAENQVVQPGQVLFRLDPAAFQLAVSKAEAKLAQVRTDLAGLKASYREKQAEVSLARTQYAFAQKNQLRQADLVAKNFISASHFDDAKQSTELAAQQIGVLDQDLNRIAETLGGSVNSAVVNHPSYREAQAELEQAKLDLVRTEVRSGIVGIASKPPKRGQYLAAGSTALALVASGNQWVEANFTETDLTYIHPGQPVSIHIDTYPDIEWTGVVDSLSPATGAEFSVIPAQNATGNWVKIAQRVPVRIKLDVVANRPPLRTGLSAIVKIDTGHRRHLFGFTS